MRMRLFLTLLALPMLIAAQTKKPATTQLDVDRLYAKYKDKEAITISSPSGDITAEVKIMYNEAGKPYAVILYGWASFQTSTLNRLISDLKSAKEKAGYRQINSEVIIFESEVLGPDVYQKKTQYARYALKTLEERNRPSWDGTPSKPAKYAAADFFYIEVGDFSRRTTKKQEDFTF